MEFPELSAVFSSELVNILKFYLLSVVAAVFIFDLMWFVWSSTGTAPLDYYIWLVQLTQSPGRRIVQVFTTNSTTTASNVNELDESYQAEDHLSGDEVSGSNPSSQPSNNVTDDSAEQTTVVIIQTPYSASRLSSSDAGQEGSAARAVGGRGSIRGVNPTDSTLINDLTRAFLLEFSTSDGGSSNAGEPVSASTPSASTQLNASELDDIDAIYRVLRTNTDRDVARAATIALYSRLTQTTSSGGRNVTATNSSQDSAGVPPPSRSLVDSERGDESTAEAAASESNNASRTAQATSGADNVFISYDSLQVVSSDELFSQTTGFSASESSTGSSVTSDSSLLGSSFDSLWSGQSRRPSSATAPAFDDANDRSSDAGAVVPSDDGLSTSFCVSRLPSPPREEDKRSWDNASMTIRLKFLDDTQQIVKTWLETTVGDFKRRYFAESLETGKVVRLIFQGQLLRDDSRSLGSYGIHDQCAVHCHVGTKPYQQPTLTQADGRGQSTQSMGDQPAGSSGGSSTRREAPQSRHGLAVFGTWLLAAGVSRLELLFFMLWSGLTMVWLWSQPDVDENNNVRPPVDGSPTLWQRGVRQIRATIHLVLRSLVDPALFTRTQRRWIGGGGVDMASPHLTDDDDHHFNFGSILGLLVAVKLSTIWLLVLYYPSVADLRNIILLMLTSFTALLFIACHNGADGGSPRFNVAELRESAIRNYNVDRRPRWPSRVIHR